MIPSRRRAGKIGSPRHLGIWRLFELFDELDLPLEVCLSPEP